MATGNFSNGGRDTTIPPKRYIGVRLQQGVPLLEDGRLERSRGHPPVTPSGASCATTSARVCRTWTAFSQSPRPGGARRRRTTSSSSRARAPLTAIRSRTRARCCIRSRPGTRSSRRRTLRIRSRCICTPASRALALPTSRRCTTAQDINLETCLRDWIDWMVAVVRAGQPVPADGYVLAEIARPAGSPMVTSPMIKATSAAPSSTWRRRWIARKSSSSRRRRSACRRTTCAPNWSACGSSSHACSGTSRCRCCSCHCILRQQRADHRGGRQQPGRARQRRTPAVHHRLGCRRALVGDDRQGRPYNLCTCSSWKRKRRRRRAR